MGDIVIDELKAKAMSARRAARNLARLPTDAKNKALNNIARCIQREERIILANNAEDIVDCANSCFWLLLLLPG